MKAAILARFSTDKQRETSCDDQIRVCTVRADRESWPVAAVYRDEAVSGSVPVAKRQGGARMLADALAGRFDVLLLEGLDRLSRDLVEQERIVRRLEHRGIRLIGISDGYDSDSKARKLHRGMRGLINEIYLDDLRDKVHRGLTGQFDRGHFAGGLSYGYRSIEVPGGHDLEIVSQHAQIVRRILADYAACRSARRIVYDLNAERLPAPRGGTWAISALYGSPKKGTGILNNVLYTGRYIWNRTQWLKDPDTGKRRRVERPKEEWKISQREDLRIVDDATWAAVQARMHRPRIEGGASGRGARPSTLLGGILRCGLCGGAVIAVNANRYGCAARKDRGPSVCAGLLIDRRRTDVAVLGTLRDRLLAPASIAAFQRQVREIRTNRHRATDDAERTRSARRAQLEREIANLTDAIAAHGLSQALTERLRTAEAEHGRLAAAHPTEPPPPPAPDIQATAAKYRRLLADLPGTLRGDPAASRAALMQLLGQVNLIPENNEIYAEFQTHTDRLLLAAGADSSYLDGVAGVGSRIEIRVRVK